MEISGSFSTMALPELLQWLSLSGKTGALTLERKQIRKMIYFTGGRIVSAASNDPREYFGQFLLRSKLLSETELHEAFQAQRRTGAMLGKILVDSRRLNEEQVVGHLIMKAEETILEAFLWREADFRFVESRIPDDNLVAISLDLMRLVAEGSRRLSELSELRQRLPSNLTTFEVSWDKLPPEDERDGLLGSLVVMADDGRNLAEMCLELHESELTVLRLVRHLMDWGALRAKEAQELEAEDLSEALVGELIREGEDLILIGRAAEAVDILRKAARIASPVDVEALIAEATRLWKESVDPAMMGKVPTLVHDVPRDDQSPEERFVLSRSNGSFSVDSISKLAPFSSDEVVRIIKKYLDRGSLRLREPMPINYPGA